MWLRDLLPTFIGPLRDSSSVDSPLMSLQPRRSDARLEIKRKKITPPAFSLIEKRRAAEVFTKSRKSVELRRPSGFGRLRCPCGPSVLSAPQRGNTQPHARAMSGAAVTVTLERCSVNVQDVSLEELLGSVTQVGESGPGCPKVPGNHFWPLGWFCFSPPTAAKEWGKFPK